MLYKILTWKYTPALSIGLMTGALIKPIGLIASIIFFIGANLLAGGFALRIGILEKNTKK